MAKMNGFMITIIRVGSTSRQMVLMQNKNGRKSMANGTILRSGAIWLKVQWQGKLFLEWSRCHDAKRMAFMIIIIRVGSILRQMVLMLMNSGKKIDGKWYYFKKWDYIWLQDEWHGNYYLTESGVMATGELIMDDTRYTFF